MPQGKNTESPQPLYGLNCITAVLLQESFWHAINHENHYHKFHHSWYIFQVSSRIPLAKWVECSPMVRETWVQFQIESYQRLKKWYLMPLSLTPSIIRYGSRVKWSNPGNGVAPSPTPWCSGYWQRCLWVALDWGRSRQLIDSKLEKLYLFWPWDYSKKKKLLIKIYIRQAKARSILSITLNCIRWWSSDSRVLGECGVPHCHYSKIPYDLEFYCPIHGSNNSVWKLFVLDKNSWNHVTAN